MRIGSVLKTELDAVIRLTIDGKRWDISKREAIVRRLFAKALRGDIRALEIFLQHARKRDAADPQPPYIIKYYKDTPETPEAARDDKGDAHGTARSTISTETTAQAIAENAESKSAPTPPVRTATVYTGRIRAPGPHRQYYIGDRRYTADDQGIIDDVPLDHRNQFLRSGCTDA
jgi:hypothetical protein